MTSAAELDAANPRRRVPPLERLKRRSASARWNELRQRWQFDHSGSESDISTGELEPAEAEPDGVFVNESDAADGDAASALPELLTSGAGEGNTTADTWTGLDPLPTEEAPDRRSNGSGYRTQPVPALPAMPIGDPESQADRPLLETERPSFVAQETPSGQGRMGEPGDGSAGRTAEDPGVLPKPITSILPYYDYVPGGEDPCEYLCPRPPNCPEGDDRLPCPEFVPLPATPPDGRAFVDMHMLWEPSNLFHNPLYFEDHTLERYGHTHGYLLQPLVSAGKFGVQLIGLPYQIALHPVHEKQYTLGWHRPGECVPYRYHFPPWNTKAAAAAAAAYTGLIFLIP